jgi:hypothetical protein
MAHLALASKDHQQLCVNQQRCAVLQLCTAFDRKLAPLEGKMDSIANVTD